jgi:hypothetical protein
MAKKKTKSEAEETDVYSVRVPKKILTKALTKNGAKALREKIKSQIKRLSGSK